MIGRFAFNIYDEGGLLDANVAGYPIYATPLTASDMQSLKSTETGAYLFDSLGPIIPDFDTARQTTFVNTWKFKSDTTKVNFLLDFMSTSPTFADSGFMRPTVRGSNSNTLAYFRQGLIRASIASSAYLSTSALPYFTHFSRE